MLSERLVKSRTPGFLVFTFIVLGIWLTHLWTLPASLLPENPDRYVLFAMISRLMSDNFRLVYILSLLLLVLNSFILHRIYLEYISPGIHSLYPAIIFVLIMAGLRLFPSFQPGSLAVFFLLFGLNRLFSAFDKRKPFSHLFDAGFLLGAGSLFYYELIILLPAFMVGAYFLSRDARWREVTLVATGALVPLILTTAILFLTGSSKTLSLILPPAISQGKNLLTVTLPVILFLSFLGLLVIAGSYLVINQVGERKVSFRTYYLIFFLLFLLSILTVFLVQSLSMDILTVAAVPVTFLLTNYFLTLKNRIVSDVFLILTLLLVAAAQFL